jgi:hypothetical protein
MKFKIVIYILTIAIIGLFVTAVYQSSRLVIAKNNAVIAKDKLKQFNDSLQKTYDSLASTKEALVEVMKKLNVYEKSDRVKREKQLQRGKYNLGINVQANDKNYQSLIAFAVTSGFEIKYINQHRQFKPGDPVIYYYSDDAENIAEQLKNDLTSKFDNLAEINVMKGISHEPPSTITAELRFINQ